MSSRDPVLTGMTLCQKPSKIDGYCGSVQKIYENSGYLMKVNDIASCVLIQKTNMESGKQDVRFKEYYRFLASSYKRSSNAIEEVFGSDLSTVIE